MSYVSVTMADGKTAVNLDKIIKKLNKANKIFPEIQMMMVIETGETTALTISVYENEAAADKGAKQRGKFLKELNAELEVSFEDPLAAYFYSDTVKAV